MYSNVHYVWTCRKNRNVFYIRTKHKTWQDNQCKSRLVSRCGRCGKGWGGMEWGGMGRGGAGVSCQSVRAQIRFASVDRSAGPLGSAGRRATLCEMRASERRSEEEEKRSERRCSGLCTSRSRKTIYHLEHSHVAPRHTDCTALLG